MLPPKIKSPLLASITQSRGGFQMSVPTLISGPLPLLCSELPLLPISPLTLPLPPSLPSPSLPLTTSFPYPCLPFPLHPFPLPLPSLPSHSLAPSFCSSFLPCPFYLSPSLTSPIFLLLHPSPLPPSSLQPECDTILAGSQNLLQLAHPKAVSLLPAKDLEQRWLDLCDCIGQPLQK